MTSIFGTGTSALAAFQRALATTSHNIANVNTEGYSRQRVELSARQPQAYANGYVGKGVNVDTVQRMFDDLVNTRVNTSTSAFHQQQTMFELTSQIDNLLADPSLSLSTSLQSFFNSVQEVADDPTSTAARQVMLTEGESLVDRFSYLDQRLNEFRDSVNDQLTNTVADINSVAQSIAELNEKIVVAIGEAAGQPPNDLLDQRDQLINQLSELVSVQTVPQDNGAVNVFIGNGQTLVLNTEPSTLTAEPLGPDLQQLGITLSAGGAKIDITNLISGGQLSGVLEFRDGALDVAQNALGRIATGLATVFNEQHREGMDLDGNLGQDFFTVPQPQVLEYASNSNFGASTLQVSVDNVSELTTEDYFLTYDGANWLMSRVSDGQVVATSAGDFVAEGLDITVDPAAVAGDRFLLRPTRLGASEIDTAIDNVRQIAAAGAVYSEADPANTGNGVVAPAEVLDPTDPNLLNTVTLVFDTPGTYQVNGVGPSIPYTNGANIDLNGWRTQITGTPQTGDTFTLRSNAGGVGDNRNALDLGALQTALTLEASSPGNPTASFAEAYNQLVGDIGTQTRQAEITAGAQEGLLQQAVGQREAISGVNLDEEAANLLRFQQAYQAAAQVLAAADQTFQTLLSAVRS